MINEIRSGMNVKRFHTTYRAQEETVGHHSANVAAILLRLAPDCSRNVLVAALVHDVPEVYTGDVPAPFKWDHDLIAEGLKEGEQAYAEANGIPMPELTAEERKLLKLADMMDLILSSIEDWGRGNQSARQLVDNGGQYLTGMDLDDDTLIACHTMVMETKVLWRLTNHK